MTREISLYSNVVPREDVFNPKFDDLVAPELSDVYKGTAPKIYTDPEEFFAITYFTDSMKSLVKDVSESFRLEKGMTIPLFSFFGGGKTHSLIMLYHAFRNPEKAKKYGLDVEEGVKVIVIGGKDSTTAPSPAAVLKRDGKDIRTLWGYIADQLGKYDLLETFDHDLMAPPKDKLEEVFKGEKVLILVDEIAWYLAQLKYSLYDRYYRQALLFFENLASITVSFPVVLVVTIPAVYEEGDEKGGEKEVIVAEKGYEGVVEELAKRILRAGKVYRAPIESPTDLGNVLKKRLFKSINPEAMLEVKRRYSKYVEDFKDYVDKESEKNLDSSYPFHPYYLELLKFLLENAGLQSTRDGIRLSRMIVRNLWNAKPKRSLILPSDIDLRNEELKTVFLRNFTEYDKVIDAMKNATKGVSVYFHLANYVFLSTYVYRLGLDPGQLKAGLPDGRKVVTSVLDPLYLEDLGLTPADLRVKLADLTDSGQNVEYLVPFLMSSDDRYWFTAFVDPVIICRREKTNVLDFDAQTLLKETVELLAVTPPEAADKRSKKGEYSGIIKRPYVIEDLARLIEVDEEAYNVAIALKPLCEGCDPQKVNESPYIDQLKRFIYNVPSGKASVSPRKNANAIAVMFSSIGSNRDRIMDYAKEYLSCSQLDPSQYYNDEVNRKVARERLTSHVNKLKNTIYNLVFQYFDKLAYPDGQNDVRIVNLSSTEKTLLGNAEVTLKNENKLIEESSLDFDSLNYYLSRTNVDLENRETPISFQQVRQMFYTNPMLPWVSEAALKSAILMGLQSHRIGVQTGSRIYFKQVENAPEEFSISIIRDDSLILPAQMAAKYQVEALLSEEKEFEDGDKVRRIYYVVATEDGEVPLRELVKREDWFFTFANGTLRRKDETIESGVNLLAEPRAVRARQGERVTVKVRVERLGSFDKEVRLEASRGSLSQSSGVPPFETTLTVDVTDEQPIRVRAVFDGKERYLDVPVELVREEVQCEKPLSPDEASPQVSRVEVLDMKNVISILDQLKAVPGVKTVEGEVTVEDPSRLAVTIRPRGMKLLEFVEVLNREMTIVGLMKSSVYGRVIVRFSEAKPLEDKDRKKLLDLISKNAIAAWVRVC